MHSSHAVAPATPANVPPAHRTHALSPAVAYVPGLHCVGATEPVGHALPLGHGVHSELAPRLVTAE